MFIDIIYYHNSVYLGHIFYNTINSIVLDFSLFFFVYVFRRSSAAETQTDGGDKLFDPCAAAAGRRVNLLLVSGAAVVTRYLTYSIPYKKFYILCLRSRTWMWDRDRDETVSPNGGTRDERAFACETTGCIHII